MQKQNTLPAPSVLIETLWNVNRRDFDGHGEMTNGFNRNIVECKSTITADQETGIIVLIETLWNVNAKSRELLTGYRLRFNRNIVECKFEWWRK